MLAEAIIGKERYRLTGTEPTGTYLRRPDEAQSWLASGGVQIEHEVARWLDGEIVQLDPAAIRRIEIERAGEPGYAAERAKPGDPLQLAGLAEGEALKQDADLNHLTGALSSVRLDDVKPRDQLSWPAQQHTARIDTFEGVELTVHLAQIDDQYWATFDARRVAPAQNGGAAPAAEAKPDAPAGEQGALAAARGGAAVRAGCRRPDGRQAGQSGQAAARKRRRAISRPGSRARSRSTPDQLNQRLGKWAYRIPEHLFKRLSTARAELVQDRTS